MILAWLIIVWIGTGLLAWLSGKWNSTLPKIISLAGALLQLGILIAIFPLQKPDLTAGQWMIVYSHEWIPSAGIQFKLAMDGISYLMVLLTAFLGVIAVLVSWREIKQSSGFFHLNLMLILAGITGVFLSTDLFLFYFSWELMLVPMYFLISIWGFENRTYAATKFFLFTQASGLIMFISILGLYFVHGRNTGHFTFDYDQLIGTEMSAPVSFLLMLGFLIAFLVKLSTVPFHSWLPDAHTQAPTAGSVILAGLLLKTGAYGLIRFVLPLFPEASHQFATAATILGAISILYGAKLAFAQTDLKRMIAYISVSHMGFVLLGVYAFNKMALQGVIMQLIAHAISTGGLFIIAGTLHERINTREIGQMGGLWSIAPRMGTMALVFVLASLGLPGLGNFIAEILVLTGSYMSNPFLTAIATTGFIAATVYSLRIMEKVFYGKENQIWKMSDFGIREMTITMSLVMVIIFLGLYPSSILEISKIPVQNIIGQTKADRSYRLETGIRTKEHMPAEQNYLSNKTAGLKINK